MVSKSIGKLRPKLKKSKILPELPWSWQNKPWYIWRPFPKGWPLQECSSVCLLSVVCCRGHSLRLGMSSWSSLALRVGNQSNDWCWMIDDGWWMMDDGPFFSSCFFFFFFFCFWIFLTSFNWFYNFFNLWLYLTVYDCLDCFNRFDCIGPFWTVLQKVYIDG